MEVQFYLPGKYLPDLERQKAWKAGTVVALEQGGKTASAQAWIYQTWLALSQSGFATTLVHEIPTQGVMVSLAGFFGTAFRPASGVIFIGVVADAVPHHAAHLHVVQNAVHAARLRNSVFMPHWPQPNLIPRDAARGDRFENAAFFGDAANLAGELQSESWREELWRRTGIRFRQHEAKDWHNYSEVDVAVAIRAFGQCGYLRKPATKLYNAWLAGVPFIGGMDSAYAADGSPEKNFLQATSSADLIKQLLRLKEDAALRESLVSSGRLAVQEFSQAAIRKRWECLLGEAVPRWVEMWNRRWMPSQKLFVITQRVGVGVDCRFTR